MRAIYDDLRDAAIASRANKVIGDKMIMNAAFLVARDQAEQFDAKVHEIGKQFEGKLSFRYTGPWPPYNFVTIRLQLERSAPPVSWGADLSPLDLCAHCPRARNRRARASNL